MSEICETKNRANRAPLEDQHGRVDSKTFRFSRVVPTQAATQCDNQLAEDWQHGSQYHLPSLRSLRRSSSDL